MLEKGGVILPEDTTGAMAGLKVIDLTRVLGGPYATQILADHGACVIKVEPPQGDEVRDWGPPFFEGNASYFLGLNRNKRSLALDLSKNNGRDVFFRLLEDADVLIENLKTGTLEKWHLGYDPMFSPVNQGFDEFRGFVSGNVDYHSHIDQEGYEDWWEDDKLKKEIGYSTDLITKHSIDFIKKNKEEKFLLYIAHESPHYPFQGRNSEKVREIGKEFIWSLPENKSEIYKEMIEVMDEGVGKVIDLVYELNIEKNTIIFFFSDNGGTRNGNNGPYRGYKGSLYEGGHRVASMVWSPSIIKKGIKSDETFMTIDILPTISDFIGGNINHSLDGVSMKKHIMFNQEINDRLLFWEYNSNYAVRKNNWKLLKLIKNNKIELYDLSNDLQEKNDVSALHPDLVKELLNDIEKWKKDIKITSKE